MHKKFDKIPRWAIDSSDDTFPTLQTEELFYTIP